MNYILFDGPARSNLLPFTFTRPVADIRVGILTIREKWEKFLNTTTTTITEDYLSDKFPMVEMDENVMINASYLPNSKIVTLIKALKENQVIYDGENVIAFFAKKTQKEINFESYKSIEFDEAIIKIENTWDIFSKNRDAIESDFSILTKDRVSQPIPDTVHCINKSQIFIEEGAKVEIAVLNATKGSIYIGENAEIMESCVIRGPFALCNDGVLKIGAKIYGPTTVGPHSKVGGEVNNSVIFGYSNKGHEGFLGNSVLGEWCNIGADTNNSNLKNNYAEVRVWDYNSEGFARTGLHFCGLIMGDHSKCGINTMFNTGTVIGVSVNIFGSGFPRNFVPSFSWGGHKGFTTYMFKKAFEVAKVVMSRKNIEFTDQDFAILEHIFEETKKFRRD